MGNSFKKAHGMKGGASKGSKELAFKDKYTLGKELGSGAFSVVRLGTSKVPVAGTESRDFAIKVIQKASLSAEDLQGLKQEIEIMKEIDHRHVIRLYEYFQDPKEYFLVTELVEGGELFERIVKKSRYSELEARDCVKTILQTMAYLHDRGIVHRDLKPENLLLTSKTDDADIKVADFGFAKHVAGADADHALDTQCGTPGYVAPEILKHNAYGTLVDVWSIGVIVYIMLGGYPPFYSDNQTELFKLIKKGLYQFHPKYWDHISEDAKDLIRNMLVINPDHRPSCATLLKHTWITHDEDTLSGRDISGSLAEMRAWNVKRKFRGAVNTIVAARRMSNAIAGATGFGHHTEPGDEASAEATEGAAAEN